MQLKSVVKYPQEPINQSDSATVTEIVSKTPIYPLSLYLATAHNVPSESEDYNLLDDQMSHADLYDIMLISIT